MKLILISDTHGQHNRIKIPKGDILIHAGDMSLRGSKSELKETAKWLGSLNFPTILAIAGNHDFCAEQDAEWVRKTLADNGVIYLQDSGIEIEGVKFYGSPWTPTFFDWAFMKDRGFPIRAMWNKIPNDTDVLITHGPPRGILDVAQSESHAGCDDLFQRITDPRMTNLQLHVCGHLHEGFGQIRAGQTLFVNAAQLDDNYQPTHWPIVVEL